MVFYGVLTPSGLVWRLFRRDPLGRRLDRLFSAEGTRVGPYRVLERIGEGGPEVGARYVMEVKLIGSRTGTMEYRITELEAPSRLVLVGELFGANTASMIAFGDPGPYPGCAVTGVSPADTTRKEPMKSSPSASVISV